MYVRAEAHHACIGRPSARIPARERGEQVRFFLSRGESKRRAREEKECLRAAPPGGIYSLFSLALALYIYRYIYISRFLLLV